MIRDVKETDAQQIVSIYNYYIANSIITFDETPVDEKSMTKKITDISEKGYPFIVYEEEASGDIIGYAYVNNWRNHAAYRTTLEVTVYIMNGEIGKGIGSLLYKNLLERVRLLNVHSLISVLSLPNKESRALHEKFGFVSVGTFKEVGFKFGKFIDVEFWQLTL